MTPQRLLQPLVFYSADDWADAPPWRFGALCCRQFLLHRDTDRLPLEGGLLQGESIVGKRCLMSCIIIPHDVKKQLRMGFKRYSQQPKICDSKVPVGGVSA